MADWYVAFFVKAARRSCTPAFLSSHENAHACQNKNQRDQQRTRKGKAERTRTLTIFVDYGILAFSIYQIGG